MRTNRDPRARRWALLSVVLGGALSAACSSTAATPDAHDLCRAAGFRPRIVQEATRAQAVAAMVTAGSGIAILPLSVHRVTGDAVCAVRLVGPGVRVVYLFAHRTVSVPPELAKFVLLLRVAS